MRLRSGGEILADDIQEAAFVARVVDGRYRAAGRMLGYTRREAASIWIVPGWSSLATTFDDVIIFDPQSAGSQDFILTHEFVHWHSWGTVIQRNLSHPIQEGLCDWIAAQLVTNVLEIRHEQLRHRLSLARADGRLPRLMERLDMPIDSWLALPAEDSFDMLALAFVLVDRIGVHALRAAAERGPVSADMVLRMAGVAANGDGLPQAAP